MRGCVVRKVFSLFTVSLLIVLSSWSVANAQLADSSCSPQVMDAMESKAWLHGQRRIAQNKNLIYKPDSVIEYSCFNQALGVVSAGPQRKFSEEETYWGPITAINGTTLDYAFFEVIVTPMINYLNANFSHTYLNDRMPSAGGAPPVLGTFNCPAIAAVWEVARCDQFNSQDDTDGFYDFPWYVANDPRQLPGIFTCTPDTRIAAALTEAYRGAGASHGTEFTDYALVTENPNDTVNYDEDPIMDAWNNAFPAHTTRIIAGACSDSAMVPTGVVVERYEPTIGATSVTGGTLQYDEHFCSKPGCSYDGSACVP